jgi:hypothetical protein
MRSAVDDARLGARATGRRPDAAHVMNFDHHIALVFGWLNAVQLESAHSRVDAMQVLNTGKNSGAPLELATDSEMARASIHEASHAVLAYKFGLRIRRALVRADASGAVEHEPAAHGDLLGAAVTALAAPFAELICGVDRVREFHLAHGPDILMARCEAEKSRARDPQLSNEVFAMLSCCAVVSNWEMITRVAAALRLCGELDNLSIEALCERLQ